MLLARAGSPCHNFVTNLRLSRHRDLFRNRLAGVRVELRLRLLDRLAGVGVELVLGAAGVRQPLRDRHFLFQRLVLGVVQALLEAADRGADSLADLGEALAENEQPERADDEPFAAHRHAPGERVNHLLCGDGDHRGLLSSGGAANADARVRENLAGNATRTPFTAAHARDDLGRRSRISVSASGLTGRATPGRASRGPSSARGHARAHPRNRTTLLVYRRIIPALRPAVNRGWIAKSSAASASPAAAG